MKKTLLVLLALIASAAQAQYIPESTSSTPATTGDMVNVPAGIMWGRQTIGANSRIAQVKLNADGSVAVSGTTSISGSVSLTADALAALTQTAANTSVLANATNTAGSNFVPLYVRATGYTRITETSRLGFSVTAGVQQSLTALAGSSTLPTALFEINNCANVTGMYYEIYDGTTAPVYFTNNPVLGKQFICGSTFIDPPEVYLPNNPHVTFYGYGLSGTSGVVSFGLMAPH